MWPEIILHAIPIRHGAASDPYIVLGLTTLGVLGALAAGMLLGARIMREPSSSVRSTATAILAGAILFLLYDLLKQTASLGQGLTGSPLYQATLLAAFVAGAAALPLATKTALDTSARSASSIPTPLLRNDVGGTALLWAWAVGIGMHGAGEAWIVGTEALTADITAPFQATSFLVHKLVEGATIPVVAALAASRRMTLAASALLALLALAAGAAGYAWGGGRTPVVLFALGAGAATSALLMLARRIPWDVKHVLLVGAGVALIYLAGLLHEL